MRPPKVCCIKIVVCQLCVLLCLCVCVCVRLSAFNVLARHVASCLRVCVRFVIGVLGL